MEAVWKQNARLLVENVTSEATNLHTSTMRDFQARELETYKTSSISKHDGFGIIRNYIQGGYVLLWEKCDEVLFSYLKWNTIGLSVSPGTPKILLDRNQNSVVKVTCPKPLIPAMYGSNVCIWLQALRNAVLSHKCSDNSLKNNNNNNVPHWKK